MTSYCWRMATVEQEHAALFALLRESKRWNRVAADVAFEGSALALWSEQDADGLFETPGRDGAIERTSTQLADWAARGLRYVTVLDDAYPQRLRDIVETPPFLFYEGDLRSEDVGMSVVGSRHASSSGLRLAGEVARFLVSEGLTVIAGLAAGIDTAAHRAALDADGRTVAFVGTGITQSYPAQNAALQREIATKGLVLSQFYPDGPPTKQTFPMRNASMSGYGLATIVIEAGENSGTRIQARKAMEHGRPVILTSEVAGSTTWGAALSTVPGVHVVSSMAELASAVKLVRDAYADVKKTIAELAVW
jgi:DNA processing protein